MALGAGNTSDYDDGMLEREDEIDMLNDETFGDRVLYEDWEEQHKRLADEHESSAHLYESQPEPWLRGKTERTSPNELESDINKLVVDDDDFSGKGHEIPGARKYRAPVDLDNLFGPSSPPGLYGTEDSFSGTPNIWGSPSTKNLSTTPKQEEDGLKMLLKQMQAKGQSAGGVFKSGVSSSLPQAFTLDQIEGGMAGSPAQTYQRPMGIPRGLTVEELERQMTSGNGTISHTAGRAQGIPTSMSHHQQDIAGSPAQMLIGTPPQRGYPHNMPNGNPNVRPVTTGPMTSRSRPIPSNQQGFYQANRQRHLSGGTGESPMGRSPIEMAAMNAQTQPRPPMQTPQHQRVPANHAYTDPYHHRSQRGGGPPHSGPLSSHVKQNLFHDKRGAFDDRVNGRPEQFQGHPHHGTGDLRGREGRGGGPGSFGPNGLGYPHRGSGYPGEEQRGVFHNSHYSSRDRDNHYFPDRGRGGHHFDDREYRKRGPGEHFQYKQRHMVGPAGDEEDENKDPYEGLMTKKEKDWIIKIQLMQLQSDQPYLDDYYYTMWQIKKLAEAREKELKSSGNKDKGPSLVLPTLACRVETKAYMPVQFDNSLGRLTAASVHNPRQVIDLKRENSQEGEDQHQGRELKRFKQLLLNIETAYDVLLIVLDLEKKADALPEDQRIGVYDQRRQAISSLYCSLHLDKSDSDYFERLVTLRKGIKLLARLLPLLQQDEARCVVTALLRYTTDVMNKKGWWAEVLPPVLQQIALVFAASKLEHLVQYAVSLQGQRATGAMLGNVLLSQFGSSVIWCLLARGEEISQKESPLDLEVKDQKDWKEFVGLIADCLADCDITIATSRLHVKTISTHFKRLLDRGSLLAIEDKLSELCASEDKEL